MLVDTHCHLDFERFDEDRDEVVARAAAGGVKRIIVPALGLENATKVLALAERYTGVYAAVGVHPNYAAAWEDGWIDELRRLAAHEKVVAIGEIGLDYYRDYAPPEKQQRALQLQAELAAELGKPVILHNREADADLLRLLAASPLNSGLNPGVFHSFSSSWETAERALQMGFYLGFNGPITYPNGDNVRETAARVPVDKFLVETDAPFLAPQSRRGKRNEPAYVVEVVERLAQVREMRPEDIAGMSSENAACLFGRSAIYGDWS